MALTVLHATQPTDGGLARVVAELAADQVGRGWRVTVACPRAGPLVSWIRAAGASHARWEARREPGPQSVGEARRLGGVVRAVAPDLVHLHSSKAGLVGRLSTRGRRCTVFQPHAWSFEAVGGAMRAAVTAWERHAARWADVILCVSEGERRRGERAGVAGRYRVIPNGIDLAALAEAPAEERVAARKRLGLENSLVVVCVGRLSRQKGQDICLDAWPAVLSEVPEAQLVLVGDGPERATLNSRMVSRVRVVGDRDDVPDWLAAADVVAAPSRWEGMSLVVLEAMAVGRSVVASEAPGMRELLGGEAGAVVPVSDPNALAGALIERLLDPPRAAAEGRAARRRAERGHDLSRMTNAVAELYEDCLARRGGPTQVAR